MIHPPPFTSRIHRQSAKFSYHPQTDDHPLDQIKRRHDDEHLKKIVIGKADSSERELEELARTIRIKLGIMNIHHAELFPDPGGAAIFINRQWPAISDDPKGNKLKAKARKK